MLLKWAVDWIYNDYYDLDRNSYDKSSVKLLMKLVPAKKALMKFETTSNQELSDIRGNVCASSEGTAQFF